MDTKGVFDADFKDEDLPFLKHLITSKFVFKSKRKADGATDKYKARLVARGFMQVNGLNYDKTFAPVSRIQSVRLILALATLNNLEVYQLDAVTAYLNADLKEQIYMRLPESTRFRGQSIVHLKKTLYGLKQSAKEWNDVVHAALISLKFVQANGDFGVYRHPNGGLLAVYVDDFIFATKDHNNYVQLRKGLASFFEVEDLGPSRSLLGICVTRSESSSGLSYALDQLFYIDSILALFSMTKCDPKSTPFPQGSELLQSDCPTDSAGVAKMQKVPYRELVGKLMYLMTSTRLDIAFHIEMLSRFVSNPGRVHWEAAKHLLAYITGTKDLQLVFDKSISQMMGYTDSD